MKIILRFLIFISILAWATAGWIWRDEVDKKIKGWKSTPATVVIIPDVTEQAPQPAARPADRFSLTFDTAKREVRLPEPIRTYGESPRTLLTVAGVFAETNMQRRKEGFVPLKMNDVLSRAALVKAQGMLVRQYFAHDSPDGFGAADLIESNGYEYVTVGENLALGNYENDAVLVQAWMDSPGHRENLLNTRFTEIGVAVVQGTYEGDHTWIAVQEFGKPLSDCPVVERSFQTEIQGQEAELDVLGSRIETLKSELDRMRPQDAKTQEEVDAYNAKIEEHNGFIAEHNRIRDALQDLISRYNNQVQIYNACLAND